MAGYQNEGAAEAEQLRGRAEELAAEARAANQNGDNYLLSTVLFASVLFFAGVTTKVLSERNRLILLGSASRHWRSESWSCSAFRSKSDGKRDPDWISDYAMV